MTSPNLRTIALSVGLSLVACASLGSALASDDDPLPDPNRTASLASQVLMGRAVSTQAARNATLERQMRLVQDRAQEATNVTRCLVSVQPTMVNVEGHLTIPFPDEPAEFYLVKLRPRCVQAGTWLTD